MCGEAILLGICVTGVVLQRANGSVVGDWIIAYPAWANVALGVSCRRVKAPSNDTWSNTVAWHNPEMCQAKNQHLAGTVSRFCHWRPKVDRGTWQPWFRSKLGNRMRCLHASPADPP
jgi:hypothetical protein